MHFVSNRPELASIFRNPSLMQSFLHVGISIYVRLLFGISIMGVLVGVLERQSGVVVSSGYSGFLPVC